jgi:serine/threonine-protein kinase
MAYKGIQKKLPEIGKELEVGAVIHATILHEGAFVQINADLIKVDSEQPLWTESFKREYKDILILQSELAQAIVRGVRIRLTAQEQLSIAGAREVDSEAFDAYMNGVYQYMRFTEESLQQAVHYFQQAIEIDPDYAHAYAYLARVYGILPFLAKMAPGDLFPKAKVNAMKAIELDKTLGEAYWFLGWTLACYEWDWSGAEEAYKRGIALHPNSSGIHRYYGWLLSWLGRHEEAVAELKRAIDLDPTSAIVIGHLSRVYTMARRYNEAVEVGKKAVEMAPNNHMLHQGLAMALAGKGLYEEAIVEYQRAVELSEGSPLWKSTLGHAYGMSGQKSEAMKILNELKQPSEHGYINSELIAVVYVGLGKNEMAIQYLEKAVSNRDADLVLLKVDYIWDPLRDDPRFQALLKKMNFPE